MKTYEVKDLFYTQWKDLSPKHHSLVYAYQQLALTSDKATHEYGDALIHVLRYLRKNFWLVNRLNEDQAVDIYNDLSFLSEPWYFFPPIKNNALPLVTPEDYLSRHTFDHFIYADNEFSSYIATQNVKFLYRLLVTIYPLPGEEYFDKESVDERARTLKGRVKDWQLNLVFFTYAQVREFVTQRCKTLLPPPPRVKANEDDEQSKPRATGAMWLKLKHRLSETPAFQGYDNAGRANMYSALDYLEDLSQIKANAKS